MTTCAVKHVFNRPKNLIQ